MAKPSLDLTAVVESVDGSDGESFVVSANRDAEKQMFVQSFSNKTNIGHESFSGLLPRDFRKTYGSPRILQNLRVVDAAGATVWEGRVDNVPPGRNNSVTAVGWYDALKDSQGVAEVYVDADLGNWGTPPSAIRASAIASNFAPTDGSAVSATLVTSIAPPPYTSPGLPMSDLWYHAPPGVALASLTATWTRDGGVTAGPNSYSWYAILGDEDLGTFDGDSTDLQASGPATVTRTVTNTTDPRWAAVRLVYSATEASEDSATRSIIWSSVSVEGDHGLTDIYASEVIKHAVGKYCPLITADSNSIYDTTYAIGHLVFDGSNLQNVIERCNAFHLYEIGVWDDRTLWFQPQRDTTDYDYLLDIQGESRDSLDIEGPRIEEDEPCNGVWVYYNSITSNSRQRVGPLGTGAGYDADGDASLLVTDDENPCNREGVNRFPSIEISFPCSSADAIQLGSLWLAEKQVPVSIGTGVANGHVRNRAGAWVPAHNIRSGDRVKFTHEDVIRRVYSATYNPSSCTNSLAFERPPATFEGINERIQLNLQARNVR